MRSARAGTELILLAGLLCVASAANAPRNWSVLERAMGPVAGGAVADIGAGRGNYVRALSEAVGPEGRVFAVDVDERDALPRLRKRVSEEGLRNVEVVRGDAADPRLPANRLKAAIIVNAYHEMREFAAVLVRVREALQAGGRLVVIDGIPPSHAVTRDQQTQGHDIAMGFAESELRQAGFEIVERVPALEEPGGKPSRWMLVAERRAESP